MSIANVSMQQGLQTMSTCPIRVTGEYQADCQWLLSCVISDGTISKFEAHGGDFHQIHLSVVEFLHADIMPEARGVRR